MSNITKLNQRLDVLTQELEELNNQQEELQRKKRKLEEELENIQMQRLKAIAHMEHPILLSLPDYWLTEIKDIIISFFDWTMCKNCYTPIPKVGFCPCLNRLERYGFTNIVFSKMESVISFHFQMLYSPKLGLLFPFVFPMTLIWKKFVIVLTFIASEKI